jgi:hypothetical protein
MPAGKIIEYRSKTVGRAALAAVDNDRLRATITRFLGWADRVQARGRAADDYLNDGGGWKDLDKLRAHARRVLKATK